MPIRKTKPLDKEPAEAREGGFGPPTKTSNRTLQGWTRTDSPKGLGSWGVHAVVRLLREGAL